MLIANCQDSDAWNILASTNRCCLLPNGPFLKESVAIVFTDHRQDLLVQLKKTNCTLGTWKYQQMTHVSPQPHEQRS